VRALPLRTRVYVLAVAVAGAGALVTAAMHLRPDAALLAALVIASLAFALARIYSIQLSHTVWINGGCAVAFGSALLLGPAPSVIASAAGSLLAALSPVQRCRCKYYQHIFNASSYMLASGASGLVWQGLRPEGAWAHSPQALPAVLAGGAVFFAVNVGLVSGVIALQRSEDSLRSWLSYVRATLWWEYTALLILAACFAAVYQLSPLASMLFLLPFAVLVLLLKRSLEIRDETRAALEAMAREADSRDPYTAQHSERVAAYVARVTARMPELSEAKRELIVRAARLHDIGKLFLDPGLVHKPGKLSDEERRAFQQHPLLGARLVESFPDYRRGRDFILYHHEHYDGRGYPEGRKGQEIPLGARIIGIADAFDAMTSNRAYRRALSYEEAAAELRRCKGTQFDPELVELFLAAVPAEVLAQTQRERLATPPLARHPAATPAPSLRPATA
jgi:hypothetical protein